MLLAGSTRYFVFSAICVSLISFYDEPYYGHVMKVFAAVVSSETRDIFPTLVRR